MRRHRVMRHGVPAPETAPRPETESTTPNRAGAKSAPTEAAARRLTAQRTEPVQDPDQCTNRCPSSGRASRETVLPASHSVTHDAAQSSPGMSLSTDPFPVIASPRESCWVTSRSQRESWTSGHEPEWP